MRSSSSRRRRSHRRKARLDELKINLVEHGHHRRRSTGSSASARSIPAPASASTRRSSRSSTSAPCGSSINVVEKDLRRIHQGTAVEVEVDAYPGRELRRPRRARSRRFSTRPRARRRWRSRFPISSYRLKPGMYARARFTVEKHDSALVVPTTRRLSICRARSGVWMPARRRHAGVHAGHDRHRAAGFHGDHRGRAAKASVIITTGAAALRAGRSHRPGRPARRRADGAARARRTVAAGAAAARGAGVNANQAQQPGK